MPLLAFAPILVLLSAAPARAEKEAGPCKADVERFCQGVEPGGGRIMKCLKEHEAELSEGCKAKGARMKEKMHAGKEACKADLEKFCKDVEPGEGRIMKCMKEHEAELSEGCRQKGAKMKERHEKMSAAKEACKGDVEKLCKGVEPGEGRIIECLKSHEAELSEGCKAQKMRKKHEKVDKKEKHKEG